MPKEPGETNGMFLSCGKSRSGVRGEPSLHDVPASLRISPGPASTYRQTGFFHKIKRADPAIPAWTPPFVDKKTFRAAAFSPTATRVPFLAVFAMTNNDCNSPDAKRNRGWIDSNPDFGRLDSLSALSPKP